MHKDDMDKILEDVFENEWHQIMDLENIDIPEMHHALEKLEKNRRNAISNRILPKWLKVVSIAACILICSFGFSIIEEFPQAQAWKFRLVNTIFEVKDDFIRIQQSSVDNGMTSGGKVPPPPPLEGQEMPDHVKLQGKKVEMEQEIKPVTKLLTMEQAEEELPFALLVPQYLPEGFTFMEVKSDKYEDHYIVEQRYRNNQDQMIRIIQEPGVEQFSSGMFTRNEVKKLLVMGEEALLITNGIDHNMVSWYKDKCIYRITGETSEKEFMLMLDSLKMDVE
ncbi:DUF4367 domain-containing protein [Petroclostridium sp. X23]|uniref:DUF4367 domain-containing protein n=1 Tax=Petroclostridium sp. X23 TaxID=3045146 RepID=UPI0024ACB094|nr:DUF4367 domain-containing protein [Petroclostridium sp. X23]WHH60206.1 DUF4367 domain-containing protein [Petroclostridium sp. X23]